MNDNKKYPINEYFLSVQGEGFHNGLLALFIRFGQCNLNCDFCDTRQALFRYDMYSFKEIIKIIKKYQDKTKFIVLTGGEPLLHDLTELVSYLRKQGFKIAVETNGIIYNKWLKQVHWITLSPKKSGSVDKRILKRASELKFVISSKKDFAFIEKFLPYPRVFLMPVNNQRNMADLILHYLQRSRYKQSLRLGIQMHKVYKFK